MILAKRSRSLEMHFAVPKNNCAIFAIKEPSRQR